MDEQTNKKIDEIQEMLSLVSQIFSKKLQTITDAYNISVDVAQETAQKSGIPTWKVTISTIAGDVVGVVTGAVLGSVVVEASQIAFRVAGAAPAAFIFINGTILTLDAANEAANITRDQILRALISESFGSSESENSVSEKPNISGSSVGGQNDSGSGSVRNFMTPEDEAEVKGMIKKFIVDIFQEKLNRAFPHFFG